MSAQKQIENNLEKMRFLLKESEELVKTLTAEVGKDWFPEHYGTYYAPKLSDLLVYEPNKHENYSEGAEPAKKRKLLFGITKTEEECKELCRILNLKTKILKRLEEANDGWVPDFDDHDVDKYFLLYYNNEEDNIDISRFQYLCSSKHVAKSKEIWKEIIEDYSDINVAKALELI